MSIDIQNPIYLEKLLQEAARRGAEQSRTDFICYTKTQACELMGISYNTLQARIAEGKIRVVDGRIPGKSIREYLA